MRILGWSIDAFGFLEKVAVRELPEGLTVFYGSNEVVKKTLLAFLGGGLFGFDVRPDARGHHPTGRGGRLFVTGPTGQLTVERRADTAEPARIVRPDGSEGAVCELDGLLGNIDRSLFDSVFTLRQQDVQSVSNLTGRDLSLRLMSIPTIGAGETVRRAAAQLADSSAQLLAPGNGESIGIMVSKIQSLRSRLDSARRVVAGYRDLRKTAEETNCDVARLHHVLESSIAERDRCATLLELAPTWRTLRRANRALQALEPIEDLPADAETRLTLAAARSAAAAGSLERLREQQQKSLRERREREPSAAFEIVADSVEDLHSAVPRHRERLGNLTSMRVRWERAKRAAEDKIQQLGGEWDTARVASFDLLRPMGEEARAWQRRLSHAAEDEQRARQALDEAVTRRESYERRRDEFSERRPAGSFVDPTPPFDVRLATARMATNLAAFPAGRMRAESKDRIVEERERLLRSVELGSAPAALSAWSWMVPWLALLGAAVVTVERGARGDWRAVLVLELAALLVIGAAYASRRFSRRAVEDEVQRRRELDALREDLEDAQREREAYWLSNVALQRVIANDSATLGLDDLAGGNGSIPALPRAVAPQEEKPAHRQPLRDELSEAVEQVEREIRILTRRLSDMRALASRMDAEWTAWKARLGLPAGLSPEGVLEFFTEVRDAQLALVARDAAEDNLRELQEAIAKWELRARTNLARAQMPVGDDVQGEALIDELTLLRNRCVRAAQERVSLAALDREIEDRAAEIATAEEEIRLLEEDRSALLCACKCADEADFRHKQRVFEERSELKRVISEHEALLAPVAENGDLEAIITALDAGTEEDWRVGFSEAEARIVQTREALEVAVERDRRALESCRTLEESDEIATLEGECAAALAELGEAVHRWRVLAVARGLLEDSGRDLEQERVPAVCAEASTALTAMTDGSFRQIRLDDRESLVVVDEQGRATPIEECGPAVTLPLYLSLRLGLIADHSRRHTPLPLIIDDIMIGVDHDLRQGLTAALEHAARDHQVLFFTCDPETCVLLADHGRAARVVQI